MTYVIKSMILLYTWGL